MKQALLSGLLLLAACSHGSTGPGPDASVSAPAAQAADSGTGAAAVSAPATPVSPPRPRPGALGGFERPLVPPSEVGQVRFAATGCLAEPTRGEAFPPPETTRAAGGPTVRVTPVKGGVVLAHPLEHACCLTARVDARTEGNVVTVTETLEGEPCRCRCGSTVRSAVGLAAGDYTLHVRVRAPGGERELWQGPVSVAP